MRSLVSYVFRFLFQHFNTYFKDLSDFLLICLFVISLDYVDCVVSSGGKIDGFEGRELGEWAFNEAVLVVLAVFIGEIYVCPASVFGC